MGQMIKTIPNEEVQRQLRDLCATTFLTGGASAFAVAMHRGLGWRLVGLRHRGVICHALVEHPHGGYFDARGPVAEAEIGQPFTMPPPFCLVIIEAEVLAAKEEHIASARRHAEAAWPDLPWQDSLAERAARFTEALETLCRQHGFWIRAAFPGARPILGESNGDEAGFSLEPTGSGSFCLDRIL